MADDEQPGSTEGADDPTESTSDAGDPAEPVDDAGNPAEPVDDDEEPDPRAEWTDRREAGDVPEDDLTAPGGSDQSRQGVAGARTRSGIAAGSEADESDAHNPEEPFLRPSGATTGFESIDRADLREHYGPIRTFFKRRGDSYQRFQRRLTQAWLRDTYDIYLTEMVTRMVVLVAAGVGLGAVGGIGLLAASQVWSLSGITAATGLSAPALAGSVAAASAVAGALAAGLYFLWRRVYRIRTRIDRRRREINYNMPYALTFMYALSRAGVSFDRVLVRLADADETYGAVSQEFERVVRDVEMFGNNLYIGLENLRAVTPSDDLRRFTDDVTTVLESGGDVSAFLRDEVDDQLDAAAEAQEAYIERLEVLSEVFVVGFVAAPLFLLVVLIVVSFLGEETLGAIQALTYVAIPLALAGFVVLIDIVSQPFQSTPVEFSPGRTRPTPPDPDEADPEWREAYERTKRLRGLRSRLVAELVRVREAPERAFLFSVPIAAALPVAGVLTGAVSPSMDAMLADPVRVTTELAVAPLVVATAPVAAVYEYRARQEAQFQRRFPDVLDLLAVSNRRGLSLTAALAIVADSTSGRVGAELERLRNDIRWNFDTAEAFEAFGDRLSSPELTRTVKLVAEGSRATSDLHTVLDVAAADTAERVRRRRQRRQALQSYLAIVLVGFLVYLLVVLMLSVNFLDPIETYAAELPPAAAGGPVNLNDIPVDQLRVVLFHSALIQGFGSGLLAGKLAEDSLYAGLKYGIGLVVVAVAAFTIV